MGRASLLPCALIAALASCSGPSTSGGGGLGDAAPPPPVVRAPADPRPADPRPADPTPAPPSAIRSFEDCLLESALSDLDDRRGAFALELIETRQTKDTLKFDEDTYFETTDALIDAVAAAGAACSVEPIAVLAVGPSTALWRYDYVTFVRRGDRVDATLVTAVHGRVHYKRGGALSETSLNALIEQIVAQPPLAGPVDPSRETFVLRDLRPGGGVYRGDLKALDARGLVRAYLDWYIVQQLPTTFVR